MLITLAVIGVVATFTIPGLVKNHNEKAWSTAKDLINKKLVETIRCMNIDGVMTGYSTTEMSSMLTALTMRTVATSVLLIQAEMLLPISKRIHKRISSLQKISLCEIFTGDDFL